LLITERKDKSKLRRCQITSTSLRKVSLIQNAQASPSHRLEKSVKPNWLLKSLNNRNESLQTKEMIVSVRKN
jgi:hypothetical protein